MKDEELDLAPYRRAWQDEMERQWQVPPRHSEEDILAILEQHEERRVFHKRRQLLWVGGIAASLLALVTVVWIVWFRSEQPVAMSLMEAQLHSTVQSQSVEISVSQPLAKVSEATPRSVRHYARSVSALASLDYADVLAPFNDAWSPTTFEIESIVFDSIEKEVVLSLQKVNARVGHEGRQALDEHLAADSLSPYGKDCMSLLKEKDELYVSDGFYRNIYLNLYGGICRSRGQGSSAVGLTVISVLDEKSLFQFYSQYGVQAIFSQPEICQLSYAKGVAYCPRCFVLQSDLGLSAEVPTMNYAIFFDIAAGYHIDAFHFGLKYQYMFSRTVGCNGFFLSVGYHL